MSATWPMVAAAITALTQMEATSALAEQGTHYTAMDTGVQVCTLYVCVIATTFA